MNMISGEMDKIRDVRRGTSRFSRQQVDTNNQQQSRPNLFCGLDGGVGGGGDFVCLEKTRKEKLRRLSCVNGNSNQHSEAEMGSCCCCDLSSENRENQCSSHSKHSSSLLTNSTSKRFKILKKFLDDCNVVDHASVPRKLRSAMKKRGGESISPHLQNSKELNHTLGGVQLHKKDGVKKTKLNLKHGESDWSRKATDSGPISKDEEEVVETLYALAGMFSAKGSVDKNKLSDEPIEEKSSAHPETVEGPVTAIEAKKEDTNSVCCPQAVETVPSSAINESSNEAAKPKSLKEPTTQDQPDLPDSKKPCMEPDCSISQTRLTATTHSLAKSEPDVEKSSSTGNFHVLSEQSLETGLKQPQQQVTNLLKRKPEIEFGATCRESQRSLQHMFKEPRNNGLTLWPGLSSTMPLGAQSPGSFQSSATKIPAWLDSITYGSRTCSLGSGSSTEKVLKVTMDRKSMKRCAAHVYISSLIRNLQMQDSQDNILQQHLQLKPHEGLKQTALLFPKCCRNLRNGVNGTLPGSSSGNAATDRNSCEARSGILQPKILYHEQPQVTSAAGMHASQMQSFDFLPLSAGEASTAANNSSNKIGNTSESLPQLQVPYLHSLPQHQSLVPFSISTMRYYTSSAYTEQLSTATAAQQVQLQLPQYPSNPFRGAPYPSHLGVTKQQQQRLWAAHLAAQYRPGGTSALLTEFPSWQNGKPESSTLMPYSPQPKIPISSSFPPARVKRPDHHLPSLYEESSGGFCAAGPLPLKLLCKERL